MAGFIYMFSDFMKIRSQQPRLMMFLISGLFVLFFPLVIFSLFHLLDDFGWLSQKAFYKITRKSTDASRRKFLTKTGLGLAGLLSGTFIYGIVWGKFDYRVLRHKVYSKRLPEAFDGLKIVQISDAHFGSFLDNFEPVKRMVSMINDLHPDYVFFTGDMVNSLSDEAEAWIPVFKEIKAKRGKFSIFGNHDYADYGYYTEEEKERSCNRLKEIHGEMGFQIMENEHVLLEKRGETISLIGVHNWGERFRKLGDLDKAMQDVPPENFKLLLSHDPTHWENKVLNKKDIDLTLSGHTHGMQLGIEIPKWHIKWSPIKYRYKRWAGLYQEGGQYLHINRGMGVLAYPGRVGMPPEISLIELRKG